MTDKELKQLAMQLITARVTLESIDIYTQGNPILDAISNITKALDMIKPPQRKGSK